MLRLEGQYPADVGVIASLFLNYVKLNHGEALYLGANEPHAYICGECIECMATSDNVVRAGLTPKHRDIQTLLSMLTYQHVRIPLFYIEHNDSLNFHVASSLLIWNGCPFYIFLLSKNSCYHLSLFNIFLFLFFDRQTDQKMH